MKPNHSARYWAWTIINQVEQLSFWAEDLLDRLRQETTLSPLDQSLCRRLVLGVIQRRAALDYQLTPLLEKEPKRQLKNLLRLAVYQHLYLQRIPVHAWMHESVQLAKTHFSRAVAGFINGVLRQWLRQGPRPLPDKASDTLAYLEAAHAFPPWLAARWVKQFGVDQAEAMMAAANEVPPLMLRVNTLRLTTSDLAQRLQATGIETTPGPVPDSLVASRGDGPVQTWPGFQEGWFYFQDGASQLIGLLADPHAHETWLDLCAAPGGKTTHLAQLMGDQGKVMAFDVTAAKRALLAANIQRMGLGSVEILSAKPSALAVDGVLVDAPCSGLGTLRRHPETKWRLSEKDIVRLSAKQAELLDEAGRNVKPGGVLVYATCTTSREENEDQVERFSRRHRAFQLILPDRSGQVLRPYWGQSGCLKTYPALKGMDGMFAAKWRRNK